MKRGQTVTVTSDYYVALLTAFHSELAEFMQKIDEED